MSDAVSAPSAAPAVSTPVDSGTKPIPSGVPAKVEPKIAERYKVAVDGSEEEVDLDTLKKMYSKGKGAEKRFEEAARLRREAEELAKTDPWELIRRNGQDPDELAAQRLEQAVARAQMSPEARRIAELEAKLAETEKVTKAEKERVEAAAQAAQIEKGKEAAVKAIDEVVTQLGLPSNPAIRYRTAQYAQFMHQTQGRVDLEECAQLAARDLDGDVGHIIDSTPEERLVERLGKARALKIGKALAKALKSAPASLAAAAPKQNSVEAAEKRLAGPRVINVFNKDEPLWKYNK